jgi:hypothetical protein
MLQHCARNICTSQFTRVFAYLILMPTCDCISVHTLLLLPQQDYKQLREFAAAQKFDKKQQQGLMQFATFVKSGHDETVVPALDLTMPYDQAAILTENIA